MLDMKYIKTTILLFFCSAMLMGSSVAQDTVIFISGRVMEGLVKGIDSLDVQIEVQKKKKTKLMYMAKNSVFAIKYGDGKTEILYEPLSSEEYSIREMQVYIKGEQDALRHTKASLLLVGGIVIGGISIAYLGPFYGLLPPVAYAILAGPINSKIRENAVSNPNLLREDTYITGYVTKARNIKIQRALLGSIVGYLSGFVAIAINARINPK